MDIEPIRTDADYRAALTRVEAMMGAAKGTPAGDKLDALVARIEAFEATHFPLEPSAPVAPTPKHTQA